MYRAKNSRLANHVVRFRRNRSQRRTPEHEFFLPQTYQVGEVGMPPGKLLHAQRALPQDPFPVEKRSERLQVQRFFRSYGACVLHG